MPTLEKLGQVVPLITLGLILQLVVVELHPNGNITVYTKKPTP